MIPIPFAINGLRNAINEIRSGGQAAQDATWNDGFPAITMQKEVSGGLPPNGMDFNGIFFSLSENSVFMQKGGRYKFSSTYASSISGYPNGAILLSDDDTKTFRSLVDNNTLNPNTESTVELQGKWTVISIDNLPEEIGKKANSIDVDNALANKVDTSAIVQTTGASTTNIISQNAITYLLSSYNSTPKNVTSQRADGVNHYNNTGVPMFVYVNMGKGIDVGATGPVLFLNDIQIIGIWSSPSAISYAVMFIVPSGSYYKYNKGNGAVNVILEYRS